MGVLKLTVKGNEDAIVKYLKLSNLALTVTALDRVIEAATEGVYERRERRADIEFQGN